MTQEEKQLLMKDLCARLPYGLKASVRGSIEENITFDILSVTTNFNFRVFVENCFISVSHSEDIEVVRPYLRPMSSMTEEEKKELSKKYIWNIQSGQIQIRYHSQGCWDDDTECPTEEYIILFDWLNARHFDYHGLIEKGLALEATTDMYNN